MTVGVLLVTHGKLGHHLLETMQDMIGPLPLNADVLEVRRVQATDVLLLQGRRMIERLDTGNGVLILTDAYGSTPSNIASRLSEAPLTEVVTGNQLADAGRDLQFPQARPAGNWWLQHSMAASPASSRSSTRARQ